MKKNQANNENTIKDLETSEGNILFAEAKIRAQESRHEKLNNLFDKSLNIFEEIIDTTGASAVEKMFPAKTVIDVYLVKEKFLREDARFELEKEKLAIEKTRLELERAKLSAPGGPLYIIQKVENQQVITSQNKESPQFLKQRKIAQAKILEEISGIPQLPESEKK